MEQFYGGIDAGGTTFKCMITGARQTVIAEQEFPTLEPSQTLASCIQFFQQFPGGEKSLHALGIASFGPLDVDPASPDYGLVLPGPKAKWAGINLKTVFAQALGIPIAIDTDVNGALLAELAWGSAKGCASAAYVTIGTGIGAGIMSGGALLGKPAHPEFGHIQIKRHGEDQDFAGVCAVHGDCLEGLASGPALWARFGNPEALSENHLLWDIVAFYLAQGCVTLSLTIRPQVIVLGGGVMQSEQLFDKIRNQYSKMINQYLGQSQAEIHQLIVAPGLGAKAGRWGGVRLAQMLPK